MDQILRILGAKTVLFQGFKLENGMFRELSGTLNKFSTTKICASLENSVVQLLRSKRSSMLDADKAKLLASTVLYRQLDDHIQGTNLNLCIHQDSIQGTNEIEEHYLINEPCKE